MKALIAALILLFATDAAAQERARSEAERAARAYMTEYSAANWSGMAPYMAEDFVLVDRTNPDPGFAPEHRSPAATLEMLRRFGEENGVIELGFDFPTVFESNGIVVFQGHVNMYAAPPGRDHAMRWRTEQVTVLTTRDGRVVRHEDYANYTAATMTRVDRPAGR